MVHVRRCSQLWHFAPPTAQCATPTPSWGATASLVVPGMEAHREQEAMEVDSPVVHQSARCGCSARVASAPPSPRHGRFLSARGRPHLRRSTGHCISVLDRIQNQPPDGTAAGEGTGRAATAVAARRGDARRTACFSSRFRACAPCCAGLGATGAHEAQSRGTRCSTPCGPVVRRTERKPGRTPRWRRQLAQGLARNSHPRDRCGPQIDVLQRTARRGGTALPQCDET